MPRNPNNSSEFIAGMLPTIQITHPETKLTTTYFVDGRLQELRNVNDFMDRITCVDDDVWELLSPKDRNILLYEFEGETID
jgi:hypothetical protein